MGRTKATPSEMRQRVVAGGRLSWTEEKQFRALVQRLRLWTSTWKKKILKGKGNSSYHVRPQNSLTVAPRGCTRGREF